MSGTINLKRGFDIKLEGAAALTVEKLEQAKTFAVKPTDFPGLTPKLSVKVGDSVKAGAVLFYDKYQNDVKFCSPVSGTVSAINRGERRKILDIVVESDGANDYESFKKADPNSLSAEEIKAEMLKSGVWPFVIQRPFGVVANPTQTPRDIFITGFDSSPLAPEYGAILKDEKRALQAGIDALSKLTDGKIYLGLPANQSTEAYDGLSGVETTTFSGAHPAGNVGIQLGNIKPVNKGEVVWTMNTQSLVFVGRLFLNGTYDVSRTIALTGSEVADPKYYTTIGGAHLSSLVTGKTKKVGNERIVSGNVLTGEKVSVNGYLGFYHNQLTILPEGDSIAPFGWIAPGFKYFSHTRTFLGKLLPKKSYRLNTNFHGGERAFVMSEEYEKFVPMDILPVYLIKSILVNDFDKMEQLGIYEVIEEDLALCEYGCTSKIEVQEILRKGIDTVIKELS